MIPTSGGTGDAQMYLEGPGVDSVCYGNTVSFTCYYPNIMDMVDGMNKYSSTRSEWAVNGSRLLPDGVTTSTETLNTTSERLDVTLTREQFEDSIIYYSCYLPLYNESNETSSSVEIDPPGEGVYLCDSVCLCHFYSNYLAMKTVTFAKLNMYGMCVCILRYIAVSLCVHDL